MKKAIVSLVALMVISLCFLTCGGGGGGGGGGGSGGGAICVDADGDGYGAHCALGPDCNDNNASIHPGARELGCDAIDNNCNGQVDEHEVVVFTDANLEAKVRLIWS